jgi:hypothetical protein
MSAFGCAGGQPCVVRSDDFPENTEMTRIDLPEMTAGAETTLSNCFVTTSAKNQQPVDVVHRPVEVQQGVVAGERLSLFPEA